MELKIYNPQVDGFLKSIDWNFDELKEEITKNQVIILILFTVVTRLRTQSRTEQT
jgi:hypothetical protein